MKMRDFGILKERDLKTSGKESVVLVRSKKDKQRYVYREFRGSPEVYYRLLKIQCANLPKIYAVEVHDDVVCVLEEYIQGDSLAFILAGGPIPENQAVQILKQICQGLEVLHSFGAVHRDVKPENIILRGDEAVLIDFDASRIVHPENDTDTRVMGTTGYAAPEQYGFSQTDGRADIYALGVMLNEMLTGKHPSKYLAQSSYRGVIEKCIEVNVDKRYQKTEQLRKALCINSKSGKKNTYLRIAAVLLVLVTSPALWMYWNTGKTAEKTSNTEETSSLEIFQAEPVTISDTCWTEADYRYMTAFTYDLDGDGESETYQFGIYQENIPEGFRHSLYDNFYLGEEDLSQRTMYPCVWKGEGESYELVQEFAPMLTDAKIEVWAGEAGQTAPEAMTCGGIWKGGIQVLFSYENRGLWYYEISAKLDGQTLTAFAGSFVGDIADYDPES